MPTKIAAFIPENDHRFTAATTNLTRMTDDPGYLNPYRKAIAEHGDDFAATLWKSRDAQRCRFEVMIEMLGRDRFAGSVVVDVGCGRGDLALHLDEAGVHPARFIGIDGLEQMVEAAGKRTENLGFPTEFHLMDILSNPGGLAPLRPDVCLASGTLNAMPAKVAESVVGIMADSGAGAVCYNFLSNRTSDERQGEDTGPATRFDPLRMLEVAFDHSPRVSFRQDYLNGHDGTILILAG